MTLARILILLGYLYLACPALAQLVPGTVLLNLVSHSWSRVFPWVLVLVPLGVTLAAFLAAVVEFRAGHSWWRAAEAILTLLIAIMVGYFLVVYARYPRWLLSLDRAAVITGGVSPYVPTAFLMERLAPGFTQGGESARSTTLLHSIRHIHIMLRASPLRMRTARRSGESTVIARGLTAGLSSREIFSRFFAASGFPGAISDRR